MFRIESRRIFQVASSSNFAIIVKASVVTISVLMLFYQDLNIVFNDAIHNEATSYILAVPFILAYLIYRKRRMLGAVIPFEQASQPKQTKHLATISGILLSTTAVILYWHGSYTFTPLIYHTLALPIFASGLTLILFNLETLRQLAFPVAFLVFLTPPPSEILYGLGSTLSVISSEASNAIVSALGIRSMISSEFGNPTIIITRPDQTTVGFTVDIACSGIYSLIGFLIFAAFVAYVTRDRIWKKAAILFLGLPIVYLLNIMRITILLLIGYQFGEELAWQTLHLVGGWILIFLGTLFLLAISEKALKTRIFTKSQSPVQCAFCESSVVKPIVSFCSNCGRILKAPETKLRKSDIAKTASVAFALVLLLSIQAPVFALSAKLPAPVMIQTPNGEQGNPQILPQIPGYALQFDFRDRDFEQEAKQDFSLVFDYNKDGKQEVWVSVEIASTISSLHNWEVCLITWPQAHGYQPTVEQLDLRDVQILQNPPEIARYFAFQYKKYNQTQLVLYWYETLAFMINNASEQKHVKISLITYPESPQNVSAYEDQLLPFATAIANHWQPMKTWAQVSLVISKNGLNLAGATLILLAAVMIFGAAKKMETMKENRNMFKKLPLASRRIIEALDQTQKRSSPTAHNILTTYQTLNNEKITAEDLAEKLADAEKTGLVRKDVVNQQDEPVRVWRNNTPLAPISPY